ncbi:MAG TPA: hypothetical protein VHX14_22165 [Thermoanaerobaculia bacterium]|nr:hypothetical protein [Thermoanaerobaculia bacterium]
MVAALLTIAICIAAGWPLSKLLDRNAQLSLRLSTAFLLGGALGGAVLFLLSCVQIPWSRVTLLPGMLLVAVIANAFARRRSALDPVSITQPFAPQWKRFLSVAIDLTTGVLTAGYALFATVGPSAEADFVTIWGVKAREFWMSGGIDWHFLENPFNEFAHVDYPILLPLIFDVQTIIRGSWDARWLGALHVAFGVAALLAVRAFIEEETDDSVVAAAATLALSCIAFSPWIGLAEGPLVASGTVGLLYVRRGVIASHSADILRGALFLGIAGSFKNEGVALIAAVAAGLLLTAPRFVMRLWPAIAIVTPWFALRRLHHLQTDLTTGPIFDRVTSHLANLKPMVSALATYTTGKPLFWTGVGLALLLTLRAAVTRERFLLVAIVVQTAFFLAAYIVTPHDVTWHVRWSWERIVSQITLPLGFAAISLLVPLIEGRRGRLEAKS